MREAWNDFLHWPGDIFDVFVRWWDRGILQLSAIATMWLVAVLLLAKAFD